MAFFERVAGLSPLKHIPWHQAMAITREWARGSITGPVALTRASLAIRGDPLTQEDIDEITALVALVPTGAATAARLNRLEFMLVIDDVGLQCERQVITPNEARTRLGLPTQ